MANFELTTSAGGNIHHDRKNAASCKTVSIGLFALILTFVFYFFGEAIMAAVKAEALEALKDTNKDIGKNMSKNDGKDEDIYKDKDTGKDRNVIKEHGQIEDNDKDKDNAQATTTLEKDLVKKTSSLAEDKAVKNYMMQKHKLYKGELRTGNAPIKKASSGIDFDTMTMEAFQEYAMGAGKLTDDSAYDGDDSKVESDYTVIEDEVPVGIRKVRGSGSSRLK